jgi:glycosyltransferase involved in cell wall biosynthesis
MKLAQGEWFAFCDSDDQWLPEKLEKQLLTLKHSPYRACVTNASIKIDGVITSRTVSTWKKNKLGFKNLLQSNDIICSSVVFHRSIFKEIGGFPEDSDLRSFEDYGYWLRVSTRTEFLYINEALVIYDDHPATSIRSRNLPASLIRKKVFSDITIWIKNTIRLHASLSFILMIKIKELKIHLRRLIE